MKVSCTLKDAVSPWLAKSFPHIKKYTNNFERIKVKRGTVLISPGERSGNLFFVIKGTLKTSLVHINGQEKILSLIGENNIIYEGNLFNENSSPVLVTALDNCELACLREEKIKKLLKEDGDFANELMNYLCLKYKQLVFLHQGLLFSSPAQRLCRLICVFSDTFGMSYEGQQVIHLNLTQSQLADLLGVSRVTVANILKDMRQKGVIVTKNKCIIFNSKICPYCQNN